jgi:hypothetical protein
VGLASSSNLVSKRIGGYVLLLTRTVRGSIRRNLIRIKRAIKVGHVTFGHLKRSEIGRSRHLIHAQHKYNIVLLK